MMACCEAEINVYTWLLYNWFNKALMHIVYVYLTNIYIGYTKTLHARTSCFVDPSIQPKLLLSLSIETKSAPWYTCQERWQTQEQDSRQ